MKPAKGLGYFAQKKVAELRKDAQEDVGGPKWTSPGKKAPGPVKNQKPSNPDSPKVYVGTYAKYNSGSIEGAWLDLDDYDTYEEFIQAAKELHSDEADPELMFQDTENVPDWAYSESSIDPKFFEFMDLTSSWDDERAEGFKVFLDYYYPGDSNKPEMDALVEEFEERFQGKWNSMEDFAMNLIDDIGGVDQVQNKEFYFDREMFVRDLGFEGWNHANINDVEASPEDYPQGEGVYDPDGEFAGYDTIEDMVDSWLDDGMIGEEQLKNYFDYEKFANDLELGGDYNEVNGFVFDNH